MKFIKGETASLYTNHTKSQELFARALKVVPCGIYGHLGPAEGCMIPVSAYPLFSDRAKGSHIWDVDGNEYIDLMCAYGPCSLGYNDPDVDAAALAQLKKANCTTLAGDVMVETAEYMVDTIPSADWAFFAKNGGDATTFAMMIARNYTHRKKIVMVKGWYHGVAPWTQKIGYGGIIEEDVCNNLVVEWNKPEQFEALVKKYPGQIAAFISTPYYHPTFVDNELPAPGYWQKIREICDKNGIVLIIDDVRCSFRLDVGGSDKYFGFEADLQCYCKAIANGYNVSMITGKNKFKGAAEGISYTGSYWLSSMPIAAALATVKKMKEVDYAGTIKKNGLAITEGWKKVAKDHGFDLVVTGEPAMWYARLGNDFPSTILHQEWTAEMVKRGVFVTSHHNNFAPFAIDQEDIQYCWDAADEAYKVLAERHPEANFIK